MRALLVGAGAVGQVLGWHLQRGGARVAYLVKAKYADEARRGFTLRPLHKKGELKFQPDEVLTAPAGDFDLVVLCMSSTALKSGAWLDELARAQPKALFVAIQPGLDDPTFVAARVGAERLVWGMFPIIAFPDENGMSYWRPPLGKLPFSGGRAREVAAAFSAGGLPARVEPDVPTAIAFSGALLEMLVVALELAGWSIDAMGRELPVALAGLKEALAVTARHRNAHAPFLLKLIRPWMLKLALPIARRLAPFDVERYVQNHFTKVGDQTVAQLGAWAARADEYRLPADTLRSLRSRLLETRKAA